MDGETETPVTAAGVDAKAFQALADTVERIDHAVESIVNRTNTLVHLLDILNKRVDRLETSA